MTRPQDRQLLPGSTSTSHSAACRQVRAPVTSQHRTKQEAFWFYFHFHVDVSESSVRSTTHLPVMTCVFFFKSFLRVQRQEGRCGWRGHRPLLRQEVEGNEGIFPKYATNLSNIMKSCDYLETSGLSVSCRDLSRNLHCCCFMPPFD